MSRAIDDVIRVLSLTKSQFVREAITYYLVKNGKFEFASEPIDVIEDAWLREQIEKFVKNSGIPYQSLAKSAGIPKSTLSNFVTGRGGISTKRKFEICKKLGLHHL